MSRLYRILTLKDLRGGISIYWRICAPFLVQVVISFFGLAIVLSFVEKGFPPMLERSFPRLFSHTYIVDALAAILLAAVLIPLTLKFSRSIEQRLESKNIRAQLALLSPLDRLNRGIVVLLMGVLVYMTRGIGIHELYICASLLFVLIVALLISVSLFGWFTPQLEGDWLNDHDRHTRSS